MYLQITNYDITSRDIIDILLGTIVVIFGVIGSVICANIIIKLFFSNIKNINNIDNIYNIKIIVFILFINIIIVLLFVMLVRYISKKVIYNSLILDSLFSFIGPTIAASSLYFSTNIKALVKLTT